MALDRSCSESSSCSPGFSPRESVSLFQDIANIEEVASENALGDSFGCPSMRGYVRDSEHEESRRVLGHLLRRLSGMDLVGKEHLEGYLRHKCRLNCKAGTLFNILGGVSLFLEFLGGWGRDVLEEMTRGDLEAFVEHEQDRGLKISSVKTRLNQLYGFLGFLVEGEVVEPDVLCRKMRLKIGESLPRSMVPCDLERLLCVEGEARDRAMVLMLLRTGMRIGELLKMKVGDVDLEERKVLIYEGAKNRLGRVVYFTDDAKEALLAWLGQRVSDRGFLFYAQGRNSMCYSSARVMFESYLAKAGLSHKGYTLHCLRHSFGTELLNAGMPLECLQELMGHRSIQITRRYARLSDRNREAAYFRAMSIIERGEKNGHCGLDRQLQEIFEEEELLGSHGEELHEHP